MPVPSEDTDNLFAEDEVLGDGESAQAQNVQAQNVKTQPVVEVATLSVNLVEQVEDALAPKSLQNFLPHIFF